MLMLRDARYGLAEGADPTLRYVVTSGMLPRDELLVNIRPPL